jgi:hypothetical protein
MTIAATPVLESFVGQEYLLLTTYRRTGTQAGTPDRRPALRRSRCPSILARFGERARESSGAPSHA